MSRPERAGVLQRLKLFRADIFRSQPERLYRAWMAEMRTPLGQSVLVNDPELVKTVLEDRPKNFPKAPAIGRALAPLLGRSIFVTNGAEWERARRIIDPAFAAGRLAVTFPAMLAAAEAMVDRLQPGEVDIEFEATYAAADVIFRTLFSVPITEPRARAVFEAFRAYQRAQPLLSFRALVGLPAWGPERGASAASEIRAVLKDLVEERAAALRNGSAPDDLATKIMTTPDPASGDVFSAEEMIDQVAIFFLAGHETSASAIAWALYCLARDAEAQLAMASEAEAVLADRVPRMEDLPKLVFTRDVLRETLRLYPPVPMMVRATDQPEVFRERPLRAKALCILSPWHLHRHQRLWSDPDIFDPRRWRDDAARQTARRAYLPFSKGPRICPGAGFAMAEGVLILAMLVRAFELAPAGPPPVPVAHLTVRSEAGIRLRLMRR